jgi:hypothetical protein
MINNNGNMEVNLRNRKWLLSVFLVAFFLAFSVNTKAQLKIGATAGTNFNSFTQPGITMGGNAGVFTKYKVLNILEVQGEIKYTLFGGGRHDYARTYETSANLSSGTLNGISSVEYKNRSVLLHSVEVPLSLRLGLAGITEEASFAPKLIVGFSYAYIFGAFEQRDGLYNFNNGNQVLLSNLEENIGSDINASNWSWFAGFALDFTLDNGKTFTTEFRYQRGINNLNAVGIAHPQVTENLYSQSFSISFAYQIL